MLARTEQERVAQALGLSPAHHNTRIAILQGLVVELLCVRGLSSYLFTYPSNTICSAVAKKAAKEAARKEGHTVRCVYSITNPEASQP